MQACQKALSTVDSSTPLSSDASRIFRMVQERYQISVTHLAKNFNMSREKVLEAVEELLRRRLVIKNVDIIFNNVNR